MDPKPQLNRSVVQEPFAGRPHLVILGAGATLAAFPSGDKHGRRLPLMHNIVEVCGVQGILDRHAIDSAGNEFEGFFSSLIAGGHHPDAVREIEGALFDYFAAMELPAEPTLYDHLVLSLRPKDVIATFNWDPFLFQAMARNSSFAPMPHALFLHGNVAIGCCTRHRPVCVRPRGDRCQRCGEPLGNSRLLYPVAQKSYNTDPFIAKMWELVQSVLKDAFVVTFFGYSAPRTDVEAVDLLQKGWGPANQRVMEEIELIDIKDEEAVCRTWKPFIHSHHYTYSNSFYDSLISNHPRRSCDAIFRQVVDAEFVGTNPLPGSASWSELHQWLQPILADERDYAANHKST
jgi:hypothetical protein